MQTRKREGGREGERERGGDGEMEGKGGREREREGERGEQIISWTRSCIIIYI